MTTTPVGPRRFLIAFTATLLCSLAVFALPRAIYSSVAPAFTHQQQPARDSVAGAATPVAPADTAQAVPAPAPAPRAAAPVGLATRFTGLIGMVLIIAVGWALSRDR